MRCFSLGYFDDDLRGKFIKKPQRHQDWKKEIEAISTLVNEDIQNVDQCLTYLQEQFPSVKIGHCFYGYEIEGLSDEQIFICAEHKSLIFDIWLDNDA